MGKKIYEGNYLLRFNLFVLLVVSEDKKPTGLGKLERATQKRGSARANKLNAFRRNEFGARMESGMRLRISMLEK